VQFLLESSEGSKHRNKWAVSSAKCGVQKELGSVVSFCGEQRWEAEGKPPASQETKLRHIKKKKKW